MLQLDKIEYLSTFSSVIVICTAYWEKSAVTEFSKQAFDADTKCLLCKFAIKS